MTSPDQNTASADFVTAATHYRQRALKSLAYGVSSTPRGNQRPAPIVADRAEGAHVFDITGKRFIDYALGYGPLLLGHSPAPVIAAVTAEMQRGLRTASVHQGEAELAELLAEVVPSAELSAFVSSGSEAIQLALRVARAATGKTRIVKFRGNYHGWFDNVHVAGTPGDDGPGTLGQDPGAASALVLADWGQVEGLEALLDDSVAGVLLEPAAVNGGCFAPPAGFLETLRELTAQRGILLIFDEVITGFRMSLGGAQEVYGVTPDISVIGKAMGAGFPISAVVGSQAAMAVLGSGKLLHRGTFNGNPISVAASTACIRHLAANAGTIYPRMDAQAEEIRAFVRARADDAGVRLSVSRVGSALQLFMGLDTLSGLSDVSRIDREATIEFTADLLGQGVQTLPRGLMYLSAVHADADIAATKDAFATAIDRRAARS